jgi:O-antigen ligase
MTVTAGLGGRFDGRGGVSNDVASRLAAGATLIFAILPVAMALANRSAPAIVALAAILMALAIAMQEGWGALARVLASSARSPLGLAAILFVALAIASYGWSADRAQTLRELSEAAVPFLAGAALLVLLPRLAPRWTATAIAIGVTAGGAICILELGFDMPIRHALHLRAKAFEYNRPVLTLLALFWPLFAMAIAARREPLAWLALLVTTASIWSSHSGTAMLAQAVSALALLLAWRLPRTSLILSGLAVAIVFAFIFAFGDLAGRLLPDTIYRALAWTHAQDRVEIWRSFGAAMLTQPWLGLGFGTSVTLGDTAVASQVADELRRMLSVGHPHNGYLQIGVELGVVGCAIALATALMLLWSWRRLSGRALFARLGLFAMAAATMLVGHGAWQAWWIAVLFAGAAVTRISDLGEAERGAEARP